MAIATGQISIIDYNDALTLTGFISSNHPKTQQYNPDNGGYTPDWSTSNLVLTMSLFKLGTGSDIVTSSNVQSVKWYDAADTNTQITAGTSGSKGQILTVSTNELASKTAIDYICEVVYRDTSTNLDLTFKTSISFNKVTNGGGIADAIAWAPDGNIFKNDATQTLKAECQLWKGSIEDTTATYQWYKQDPAVGTDQGGGIGWRKLTHSASPATAYEYNGATASIMNVPASKVDGVAVYKCVITDTTPGSGEYQDTVTFVDQSDPIQVSVVSSGGTVFKNGSGSSTLTAKLFQAGEEIDTGGTDYTYKWYKYDQAGDQVLNWNGAGVHHKLGKTLAITDADVSTKATFVVDIE